MGTEERSASDGFPFSPFLSLSASSHLGPSAVALGADDIVQGLRMERGREGEVRGRASFGTAAAATDRTEQEGGGSGADQRSSFRPGVPIARGWDRGESRLIGRWSEADSMAGASDAPLNAQTRPPPPGRRAERRNRARSAPQPTGAPCALGAPARPYRGKVRHPRSPSRLRRIHVPAGPRRTGRR